MRETRIFSQRRNHGVEREELSYHFLVFEGYKTEKQYFTMLLESDARFNEVKSSVRILDRHSYERGHSNPYSIIQKVKKLIEDREKGVIKVNEVIDNITTLVKSDGQCARCFSRVSESDLNKELKEFARENGCDDSDEVSDCSALLDILMEKLMNLGDIKKGLVLQAKDIMRPTINYDKDYDHIHFVFDRDPDSFNETQYREVLKICKDEDYHLYITNPYFEFWLLLHFSDCKEHLKEYPQENKNYLKACLKEYCPGYKKSKIPEQLTEKLEDALKHARNYYKDLNSLEKEIGTNLPGLFKRLQRPL